MDLPLHDMYQELNQSRILFCYRGPMAQSSIESVGNALRNNLAAEETGKTTQMAVFSTFIELVQNVLNYSIEKVDVNAKDGDGRVGITAVGYDKAGNYCIYCGNRIHNKDIAHISQLIDSLSGLSKEELKALYKEKRKKNTLQNKKGAGLGMIGMARLALTPLEYSFDPIDEVSSFYSIKVVIGRVNHAKSHH